ncbi:mitochondrial ribosomal protein subunit L20-domain-containing protein [Irpex rosettiformis]|uniref:Mitochondrial ribosomal protein subunit L20-domain-containing protein n=1 Tax=Irpex rosettiformis TaxID=378272 RepID=A0ACB8TS58_9APHY|nr:mitochondrial ribosomal protein subunit L20-domain-containing protein [Irpex rosettiformis]
MLASAVVKPRLSLSLNSARRYASRLPQRPPARAPDPLVNNPHATYEELPGDLTFIHRPPPTAPTPESYTTHPASPLLRPPTSGAPLQLPPILFAGNQVQPERMSQEDIRRMKDLRKSDPDNWTVTKLSKEFKCTTQFVRLMAPLTPSQRKKKQAARDAQHAEQRAKWGERKSLVRDIRQKRRELW